MNPHQAEVFVSLFIPGTEKCRLLRMDSCKSSLWKPAPNQLLQDIYVCGVISGRFKKRVSLSLLNHLSFFGYIPLTTYNIIFLFRYATQEDTC